MFKRIWVLLFAILSAGIMVAQAVPVYAVDVQTADLELDAKSAVLMDANTGTLLYEFNGHEALPPASVTKIMTLLLVMEAVDSDVISMDDRVTVSDYAASMGGSQIFLEPGETMSVRDLIKSVVIASANDAAVALAELVAGSEEAFVERMNERARALGMNDSSFENVTGLDDDAVNHLTSAYDIALMSRELIRHKSILDYTAIWMDTVRDGAFGLTNTNRLIRFYNGATGLKTGSTAKAKFCISATAMREDLHLIAVVMGSSSRDARNISAQKLLDFGFANYSLYRDVQTDSIQVPVVGGANDYVNVEYSDVELLINKGTIGKIERLVELETDVMAPVQAGDRVGIIRYIYDGKELGRCEIRAKQTVEKISFFELYKRILNQMFLS